MEGRFHRSVLSPFQMGISDMRLALHWQILIAMALAVVFAWALGDASRFVEPLGTLFIRLLKMLIVPLVVLSLVFGVAGVGDAKNLGRLGIKTFCYYIATSLIAILTGLVLVNAIHPGEGADLVTTEAFSPESLQQPGGASDLLLRIVPENPIAAAAEGDMLGIIFFSILFGFALGQLQPLYRDRLMPWVEAAFHAVMKLTHFVILLAPLGVFGLIVGMMNHSMGTGFFKAVGWYMITIAAGLTLHFFVTLPLIYWLFLRKNPLRAYGYMASALATVFATSSSAATLPVTMECVEKNAGVSNKIASFVLPMGATVNMDGTALFECVGVLFIAQVLQIPLGLEQQLLVVGVALLASIGTAAIPSAGLVMIFVVLEAVGIESAEVPLIVGTMLAVDRPLDMYRGLINIFSDAVGAMIIANSEGELGREEEGLNE